jgi:hypothetical protein
MLRNSAKVWGGLSLSRIVCESNGLLAAENARFEASEPVVG